MRLSIIGPHSFKPVGDAGRWRLLREDPGGSRTIEVSGGPFVIGRSEDCHLVLPEAPELRAVTSRWHCHLDLRDGVWSVTDGSLQPMPDTGTPKPSISGTRVNGRRIQAPAVLSHGAVVEVGPWRLELLLDAKPAAQAVDASEILEDMARGEARKLDAADPRLKEKFGQIHELVQRLSQIPDIEESLTALLSYATNKIAAAEVGAILLSHPDGGFEVRLAWEKNLGKMPDFRFSSSLLASLPPDQSVLLQSKLKDRSASQSVHDISSGLLLPLWGKGARLGILYLDNRRNGKSFTEEDLYLGSAIASLASLQLALETHARLARVEENMARYFAPDVVQRIVELSTSGSPVGLDVQEKDVTVLFVDMEAFTALSRTKTPRQISEILNPYLETVAKAIMDEGGHVNKFIGDAVMGIFGAQPGETGDPARCAAQAVRAGLAIPAAWKEEAGRRKLPALRLRIGVNSGRAVVGNIGYSARLEYSVLGDTVNLASRMEKLAPPDRVAVSDATRRLTQDLFDFEDLGEKDVKGVGSLRIFSPLRPKAAAFP
jgi:adenylate cyclase